MSAAEATSPDVSAGLDEAGLRRALAVVFALDGEAERRAQALIEGFTARADWRQEDDLLGRTAEVVAHLTGPDLDRIFEFSGTLALSRLASGRYLLFVSREGRWFGVDAAGEIGAEYPALPSGVEAAAVAETVLLMLRQRPAPLMDPVQALSRVLRLAWAEVGVASLLINLGLLALPLFSMLIYNKVVYNSVFSTLWALAIGMAIFLGLDVAMRLIRNWATERIAADYCRRDDERIWRELLAQNESPKGGLARFLSNYRELAAVRDFVASGYLLSLADAPFFLVYLLVIALIAWPLALVVLFLAAVYGTLGYYNHEKQRRLNRETEQAMVRKTTFLGEAVTNLDVVRLSPGTAWFDRRWRALCRDVADRESERRLTAGAATVETVTLSTFTSVSLLVAGVYLIDLQLTTVGGLIAANLLAGRAMAMISSLFGSVTRLQDFRRAVDRLEAGLEPAAAESAAADVPAPARPALRGEIQVLGLSKRNPGRPAILDGVGFAVRPGERIALLGRPGAGKSTLLRCLARLTLPDAGQILYDGADLLRLLRQDMRRWLAYKAQDPALFAGSLEDNLRVAQLPGTAADPAVAARLEAALWASGLEDELRSGRLNLSLVLEESGRNLSGGQRQKVALARALAQGARLVLLDEPSLGLDPEAERQLAERLPQVLGADDVLLMVTHSAPLLAATPRLLVLDGGRLVADGERERILRSG